MPLSSGVSGNSPVCGLFCVCYKPRPARTTIASQVWIQFFLVLNLHVLDVVLRLQIDQQVAPGRFRRARACAAPSP